MDWIWIQRQRSLAKRDHWINVNGAFWNGDNVNGAYFWWDQHRQRCLCLVLQISRHRGVWFISVFCCGCGKFRTNFELHLPFSWDFFVFIIHQIKLSILYRLNGHWDIKQRKLQSSIHNFYLENAFIPQNPHNITSFIHHHFNDCKKKRFNFYRYTSKEFS